MLFWTIVEAARDTSVELHWSPDMNHVQEFWVLQGLISHFLPTLLFNKSAPAGKHTSSGSNTDWERVTHTYRSTWALFSDRCCTNTTHQIHTPLITICSCTLKIKAILQWCPRNPFWTLIFKSVESNGKVSSGNSVKAQGTIKIK